MKKFNFESQPNNQEILFKEDLQKELEVAEKKIVNLTQRSNNKYSKRKIHDYSLAMDHFGGDDERVKLYFDSFGDDVYENMQNNYEEYQNYKKNKLVPLEEKIKSIRLKIRKIENEEREEEEVTREIEREDVFNKAKKEFVDKIYKDLDDIYKKIPQEAEDVGMSTQSAVETYLPELKITVNTLKRLIKRAEKSQDIYELEGIIEHKDKWYW
jgi:hypothetical protein